MNALAMLTGKFKAEAAANVEYSIDHRPQVDSITVPLGTRACGQINAAGAALPFGGSWAVTVDRMINTIRPNAMLLRLDSEAGRLSSLTAYLRFPEESDATSLRTLLASTSRLRAVPQPVTQCITALGCRGIRGIGIRGTANGQVSLALYFKVQRDLQGFSSGTVGTLLDAFGWDDSNAKAIEADLRAVHPGGSVGVIGLDIGKEGNIIAFKCDPANVPLERGAAFLRSKRATPERIEALYAMSRSLRAHSLSYLGVKYTPAGFAGWRLYFSCRPACNARFAQPAVFIDSPGAATLRMPHY